MLEHAKAQSADENPRGRPVWVPVSLQILSWFFLNIVAVGVIAAALLIGHGGPLLSVLLSGRAGERLDSLVTEVGERISVLPSSRWSEVTSSLARRHGMSFGVVRRGGDLQAGWLPPVPELVLAKVRELASLRPPPPAPPKGPLHYGIEGGQSDSPFGENLEPQHPPEREGLRGGEPPLPPSAKRFLVYENGLYWIGLNMPPILNGVHFRGPTLLLVASTSLLKGGLILESTPFWIAAGILLGSALFWWPLVRRITVPLKRMRIAAEQMAQGHFDKRLDIERSDEIGSLATSLNHLAMRLEDFVTGKKQFLGDIAHELGSPLARLQYAVAIMESQARPEMQPILDDVREEVAQMAALLQEILQFTQAGLQSELKMQRVELCEALERVLQQENIAPQHVSSKLKEGFSVLADPLYLQRAIANILRNSLRYAEGSGPIQIEARREKNEILLRISDQGPGVPPELVHRLCDPFFRTESARTRETGGVGLGLSIVKRCVEACGGTVFLRNLVPHGLVVEMRLPAYKALEGVSLMPQDK